MSEHTAHMAGVASVTAVEDCSQKNFENSAVGERVGCGSLGRSLT